MNSDDWLAVYIAVGSAFVWSFIFISRKSESTKFYFRAPHWWIFALVQAVGFSVTTLVAMTLVPITIKDKTIPGPDYFWAAVIGAFGFEAVIKQLNVSFGGKGLLSIQKWLDNAETNATAEKLALAALADDATAIKQAGLLVKHLKPQELNTHVLYVLGEDTFKKLETSAASNNVDPMLMKAITFAYTDVKKTAAITSQYKRCRFLPKCISG